MAQVRQDYDRLMSQLAEGQINHRCVPKGLTDGRWWTIDTNTGDWLVWQNEAWEPEHPPIAAAPPAPPPPPFAWPPVPAASPAPQAPLPRPTMAPSGPPSYAPPAPYATVPPPATAAPAWPVPAGLGRSTQYTFVGLGPRLLAKLIDGTLIALVGVVLSFLYERLWR